jgi:uncharacterized protein
MLRQILLVSIEIYQRWVSPYKGFCCAYKQHTGRRSCSALGWRALRRYGGLSGLAILRQRMALCGVAFRRYAPRPAQQLPTKQRGLCDLGCDAPCDLGCNIADGAADCGACDFLDVANKQRKKSKETARYLPPRK